MSSIIVIVGVAVAALVVLIVALISRYRVPGADEAFVVTGTGKGQTGKVYRGTGTFVLPVVQKSTRVSLSSVQATLNTSTPANDGIELAVSATAVVKVGDEPEDVLKAGQRFRDDTDKIKAFVTQQLSGELRSIVGTMTAKAILVDRKALIDQVAEAIKTNLRTQGLALDSFSINEVSDADGRYFQDLAAAERAEQSRIAHIAQANAESASAIAAAQAEREAEQARIANQQAVIEQQRQLDVERQEARKITERAAAEADAAGPLAEAERRLIQTEKDNEVAAKAAELRQTQLDAEVKRPAEARRFETEQNAAAEKAQRIAEAEAQARTVELQGEAQKKAKIAAAQADAQSTELRGRADAEATRLRGEAEAQAIEARAKALAEMDTVGQLELILTKMPAIVEAAAKPLAGASVTLIGSDTDGITQSVAKSAVGALETIRSTTGIDLAEMLGGISKAAVPAAQPKPSGSGGI
ncbi:SPFH domain-containing protein [Gordonia sp. VNK1]|uniref:SPFH domain-containing protein n=1 Tax=Gordonia oleivorans TaxID=3156618 RepID=UPI0032B395E1